MLFFNYSYAIFFRNKLEYNSKSKSFRFRLEQKWHSIEYFCPHSFKIKFCIVCNFMARSFRC